MRGWTAAVLSCAAGVAFAAGPAPSAELHDAVRELRQSRHAAGVPFAVVDKQNAQIAVYDARGRLAGMAPVLLGLMPGDLSHADAAIKTAEGRLPLNERTTPGGRYASAPGVNLHGERIVWIDYASALAIHRLRPSPAHERRAERLASPSPADNRITLGCVTVDPAFFDKVVEPTLGRARGVVVVLPEVQTPEP